MKPGATMSAQQAADRVCRLAKAELGVDVAPEQILTLFEKHWSRLNGWSHAIHDEQEMKRKIEAQG